ncbi:MAG TPA: DNA recombination protein RmuC [Candidatus Acidoferrum sp.]|nr:DNA recombination protein RmuC [Candidatus Acidoferrum sp.]
MTWIVLGLVLLAAVNILLVVYLLVRIRRVDQTESKTAFEAAVQLLRSELIGKQAESFLALRQAIDSANQIVNERLAEGAGALDRRLSLINEIENRLGQLTTQTNNIEQIGKNIQSLSELLKPPKLRGALGELLLENLLGQILPQAMFATQYQMSDGQRVDAIVRLGDRVLPIDAKFPLEAFERVVASPDDPLAQREFSTTLKKHIEAIATRYIRPGENTTDFAVMYIPAEAVYYQLVSQDDRSGFDYALSKKVIPSSPGHLYAFLASLAAIYAATGLLHSGTQEESRRLAIGLSELAEALARLVRYHERIEGSLRSISVSFEKAKAETAGLHKRLDNLRDPHEVPADNAVVGERIDP